MNMPSIHSNIKIESIKHDGSLNRRWEDNTVLYVDEQRVIGMNYQTMVIDSSGTTSQTTYPALFYFEPRLWFNIIYLMNGNQPYYYCNICSPFQYKHEKIQYTDYDIDILVKNDFTYKLKDLEEYKVNREKYDYPKAIRKQIEQAVTVLTNRIEQRDTPFNTRFIEKWQKVMNDKCNI